MTKMGAEICARVDQLGEISAEPGRLTRLFLSPEQKRASDLVMGWMRDAGMTARIDAIGNVIGRYEGDRAGLPALLLGSHLDTVRDAGKYDGMLGVVTAIACVDHLHRQHRRLPFAIEIIGFSDEEGARFGAALLGSRAVAGTFDAAALDCRDAAGITMRAAMTDCGFDPALIPSASRRAEEILAYVELHIEQGPVLEREGLPVGCVTSINGATRLKITLAGQAGHAGTVPMTYRRDALAGAAECILAVESACAGVPGLVGTVGMIEARPGATNVIPGQSVFTLDVRAPVDATREAAIARLNTNLPEIARRRGLAIATERLHESPATPCAPWLMAQIRRASDGEGIAAYDLPSGAGHDGMAMRAVADIGMIFVRCRAGISHNPAEAITIADAEIGARVLLGFITSFRPREDAQPGG
jgi:allantoate deiminase